MVLKDGNVNPETLKRKVISNSAPDSDYAPPFEQCLFHGNYAEYHPDGRVKEEGMYINGLREGVWVEYSDRGQYTRGSYHRGKKSGEWRQYEPGGKPVSLYRYNANGVVVESHVF